jgi:hypothetical protein
MSIFDNSEFERRDSNPSNYHELSPYNYINRSNRLLFGLIRQTINKWFGDYVATILSNNQEEGKNTVKQWEGDFKNEPKYHTAALFELWLFALFRGLGYKVQVAAKTPNGRNVDFFVTDLSTNTEFYLEATSTGSGECNIKREVAIDSIIDDINKKVKSEKYGIELKYSGVLKANDVHGNTMQEIKEWIEDDPNLPKEFEFFNKNSGDSSSIKEEVRGKLVLTAKLVDNLKDRIVISNKIIENSPDMVERIINALKEKRPKVYNIKDECPFFIALVL